jgi:hypothetical protein
VRSGNAASGNHIRAVKALFVEAAAFFVNQNLTKSLWISTEFHPRDFSLHAKNDLDRGSDTW